MGTEGKQRKRKPKTDNNKYTVYSPDRKVTEG